MAQTYTNTQTPTHTPTHVGVNPHAWLSPSSTTHVALDALVAQTASATIVSRGSVSICYLLGTSLKRMLLSLNFPDLGFVRVDEFELCSVDDFICPRGTVPLGLGSQNQGLRNLSLRFGQFRIQFIYLGCS